MTLLVESTDIGLHEVVNRKYWHRATWNSRKYWHTTTWPC